MYIKHLISYAFLIFLANSCNYEVKPFDVEEKSPEQIIREANIVYDSPEMQKGLSHVPLLVSNGITGACFDHMGFQSRPNTGSPEGRTVFGYIGHYDAAENTRQIQFPLAIINARFADGSSLLNLMDAKAYKQELDMYTGILTTQYNLFGKTKIMAFAHQTIPNLFILKIDRENEYPDKEIIIHIDCESSEEQNNDFNWKMEPVELSFEQKTNQTRITSKTGLTETHWIVWTKNKVVVNGNRLEIKLKNKETLLKIWVKKDDCPGIEVLDKPFAELYASHIKEWEKTWQQSWIDFPEDRAQKIWTRMKYYALSHFPVITEKPMIPTGLNSNIWGFTFPQDVYYVAENLTRLGHFERHEKAMQYWLDILSEAKEYGRRIMDVDGAYYPWTPPYKNWDEYEKNGVVGADSYELHNPAYVAAMVWHYFRNTRDSLYLEKYFPIIEEVFRFYANISTKNEAGTYDIYHEHARGQDEASSKNGKLKNLLCASYSAEYTCINYIKAANTIQKADNDLLSKAKDIKKSGFNRENLLQEQGWHTTFEGDNRPKGSQKHPVQLNPVAYLPMPHLINEKSPVKTAWENRYQLTKNANKPITLGWTIGEFALTSARMKNPEEFAKDLSAIQPCHAADPRWIQFYESSSWEGWHKPKAYYFPMMGLYLQAFTDCIVQDWQGYTDIFGCLLPAWQDSTFSFHGLYTLGGVSVNGKWEKGNFEIMLHPGKTNNIVLQVSQETTIRASGHKKGPYRFSGNEKVAFVFNNKAPIKLTSY
jgi:hypothetical protein